MENDKQDSHPQTTDHPEADLLLPTVNHDPEGKPVYHPAIGQGALWGGLIGGFLIGLLAWLIASGIWPVAGLGQLSGGSTEAATFLGFTTGSALGGLAGSLYGLKSILLIQRNHK